MRTWRMVGLALALLTGCNSTAARLDEAKGYVQKSLDVWKNGGQSDELRSSTPPIEFHEAMWNDGVTLVQFEMGNVSYISKANVIRCEVRITVRDRKGKERTEHAVYDVTFEPGVKIVNNPMP